MKSSFRGRSVRMSTFKQTAVVLTILLTTNINYYEVSASKQTEVDQGIVSIEEYSDSDREGQRFTLEERLNTWNVAGVSIAIFNDFNIEWAAGYGMARPGVPMTSDTVLQVASVSKFITGVATLQLLEKGILDLDTDVNQFLTQWKIEDTGFSGEEKVTLRRIMSHTAGLNVQTFPGYPQGQPVPTLLQILNGDPPANTEKITPKWPPGTFESYSGGGTTVEQQILTEYAEKTHGTNFEGYMQNQILGPLEMHNSTFEVRDRENLEGIATAHLCKDNKPQEIPGYWHNYPEKAAAGMYSTPSDIAKFLIHIARAYKGQPGSLLHQDTVREMLTAQPPSGRFGLGATLYGPGKLDGVWFGHEGSNKGYCLQALANTRGQGAVVVTNGDCFQLAAENLVVEIFTTIFSVYNWIPEQELQDVFPFRFHIWPRLQVSLPRSTPQDYEGRYRRVEGLPAGAEGSPAEVRGIQAEYRVTADSIAAGENGACSFRLWPSAEDSSQYVTDMLYGISPRPVITFIRGNYGKVAEMRITHGNNVLQYRRLNSEL